MKKVFIFCLAILGCVFSSNAMDDSGCGAHDSAAAASGACGPFSGLGIEGMTRFGCSLLDVDGNSVEGRNLCDVSVYDDTDEEAERTPCEYFWWYTGHKEAVFYIPLLRDYINAFMDMGRDFKEIERIDEDHNSAIFWRLCLYALFKDVRKFDREIDERGNGAYLVNLGRVNYFNKMLPIHLAALSGSIHIVRRIIDIFPDHAFVRDGNKNTSLAIAKMHDREEVMDFLGRIHAKRERKEAERVEAMAEERAARKAARSEQIEQQREEERRHQEEMTRKPMDPAAAARAIEDAERAIEEARLAVDKERRDAELADKLSQCNASSPGGRCCKCKNALHCHDYVTMSCSNRECGFGFKYCRDCGLPKVRAIGGSKKLIKCDGCGLNTVGKKYLSSLT